MWKELKITRSKLMALSNPRYQSTLTLGLNVFIFLPLEFPRILFLFLSNFFYMNQALRISEGSPRIIQVISINQTGFLFFFIFGLYQVISPIKMKWMIVFLNLDPVLCFILSFRNSQSSCNCHLVFSQSFIIKISEAHLPLSIVETLHL